MRGSCISRTSVPKAVNRHTNLYYSWKAHLHYVYVCVITVQVGVTYLTTFVKLFSLVWSEDNFIKNNYMYISNVTTISIQTIITAMLPRLRTEVFWISITYRKCSYPVVNDVNKIDFITPNAVSTTCSTQLPGMVLFFANFHISHYVSDIRESGTEILIHPAA